MVTIVELLIVLGIMVLVHEFGHFAVAKLCGVRVETFAIGFGKRLVGFRKGETEYQINILPLGGYVKMSGEMPGESSGSEDEAGREQDPGDFSAHPRWQRMLIALAGPVANIVLALMLMTTVSMFHHEVDVYLSGAATNDYTLRGSAAASTGIAPGDLIVRFADANNPDWDAIAYKSLLNMKASVPFSYVHNGRRVDTSLRVALTDADASAGDIVSLLRHLGLVPQFQNMPVKVVEVEPKMPAAAAGLKPGDEITTIDGLAVHSVPALLAYMQDQAGKPAVLTVERSSQRLTLPVTPQATPNLDGSEGYKLGFMPLAPPVHIERLPLGRAVAEAYGENLRSATMIRDVLKGMLQRRVSPRSLQGPIGIGQQVGIAAREGIWTLLRLMSMISINLAIFNLLPIPILDGGMILFLLIETAMRRDMNQRLKERVYQVAFVCLLVFFVMVIFNDMSRLPLFSHLKP
ncbi:MAG TPA: RIP metalloprotease RseP [Granulicella sp.]|nr:RIP metalloprotease RseP [Granulicella sp.]